MEKYLKITLKKSLIGKSKDQKIIAKSLKLTKINRTIVKKETPFILGMLKKIQHLISYSTVKN